MAAGEKLHQPVECIIRIDDREITDLYANLRSVSVEANRQSAAVGQLVFDSLRDTNGEWSVQDRRVFVPWRRIRIEAAFGSHTEEVMRGYIREIKADYPANMGDATVTVDCQDESYALDRQQMRKARSTSSQPLTDGEIVQSIARENGLAAKAARGLKNGSLTQDGTAIRFLMARAEANGFELRVRQGTIHFGPPDLGGEPQATIMVYAGDATNCVSFSVQHDGHKPDEVRLVAASESGTQTVSETFSPRLSLLAEKSADSRGSGLQPFVWNVERAAGGTAAERRARAQAKADEAAWKLTASGELDGALYGHVLQTHRTVNVDGVGETYGGVWYVDEVKHEFSIDGYRQTFRLLRNATGEAVAAGRRDPLADLRN